MIAQDIMSTCVISLNVHDSVKAAKEIFKQYDFSIIPLKDKEGRLLGVVWEKDLLDIQDPTQSLDAFVSSEYIKLSRSTRFNEIVELFFIHRECEVAFVLDEKELLIGLI